MLRFNEKAAGILRREIVAAGGVEVFAIGDVADGDVVDLTVTCRGQEDRVPALLERPRAGQVVIHNHPSGDLRPSQADLQLAGLYGDDGIGVVIVDSEVSRSNWVVEPYVKAPVLVDPAEVEAYFRETLPRLMPDAETREQQVQMALQVTEALNAEHPLLCEAGTGTGKSLAYLVPAALWAKANDGQVAVSTYTRALQNQLVTSDLPLLEPLGIESAVLLGRNNYLCKRRLRIALGEAQGADDAQEEFLALEEIAAWDRITIDGTRLDLPFRLDPVLWERVESDSDLTLRVRCPHYADCHFYTARRRAASAHIVVVNHALLLADLALRAEVGRGVLPAFGRLVLDEGHHLEDAATGAGSRQLTARAVSRAVSPLLTKPRRRGSLERLLRDHPKLEGVAQHVERCADQVDGLGDHALDLLDEVADRWLPEQGARRLTPDLLSSPTWHDEALPELSRLARSLVRGIDQLDGVAACFEDEPVETGKAQPLLDVRRARRRLSGHAELAGIFAGLGTRRDELHVVRDGPPPESEHVRWLEPARGRGRTGAALVQAPVDVGPTLRRILWGQLPGTVITSATLTVNQRFEHLKGRVGLDEASEVVFDSPFDHEHQAMLALPRDLPVPDHPDFNRYTARAIGHAVEASDGGAFVLCTSYDAVRGYTGVLRSRFPDRRILAQGELGRAVMLERFKEDPRAVLVGTDSFWEGVSVKGQGLRLVCIPRLPFRVPTDPLRQARYERLQRRGIDPFKAYALPEAVLKLRQGYGRLIRSTTDRGVVLILDRRIHDRSYGAIMLRSLPPARRVVGPWRRIHEALTRFFTNSSGD